MEVEIYKYLTLLLQLFSLGRWKYNFSKKLDNQPYVTTNIKYNIIMIELLYSMLLRSNTDIFNIIF